MNNSVVLAQFSIFNPKDQIGSSWNTKLLTGLKGLKDNKRTKAIREK